MLISNTTRTSARLEKALAVSKDILQYGNEDGAYTLDSATDLHHRASAAAADG